MDVEKIKARGLTRGEIKTMRADGIVLGELQDMKEVHRDDALDRIFKLTCPDLDPDELTPGEAVELYVRITGLTHMTGEEVKNSASPHSSVSKTSSTRAASVRKRSSKGKGTARKPAKKRG